MVHLLLCVGISYSTVSNKRFEFVRGKSGFPMTSLEFLIDNPSGLTMALVSTQLLTETRTRNISCWGKGGRFVGLTILLPSCAYFLAFWEPRLPGTFRASPGLYRDCYTEEVMQTTRLVVYWALYSLSSKSNRSSTPCRYQWPCGLRRRSEIARLLRLWVRIQPLAQMSACCECCVCCQVEVSATN